MYILVFLLMKASFSLREKGHSDTSSFFQELVSVKHTMQDLICTHNKGLACILYCSAFHNAGLNESKSYLAGDSISLALQKMQQRPEYLHSVEAFGSLSIR